jgi:hypothetical protein
VKPHALLAALPLALLPLTAAAAAPAQPGLVPFDPNSPGVRAELQATATNLVETFDPIARARLLVGELPRRWTGTYQAYGSAAAPAPVQLQLETLAPVGQMVVLRGTMTIGAVSTPVQGNLNAKSDQLDLLLLGDASGAGLDPGGMFQGLQTFALSSWNAARLTNPGGRLVLQAAAQRAGARR